MKKYRIRKGSIADTTCKAGKVMCVSLAVAGLIFFSGCQTDGAIEPPPEKEIVEVTMDFKSYDVPLDKELQLYIYNLCEEYGVDPAIVISIIEIESGYNAAAIGDDGDSIGLMQIQPKWWSERMTELGATDLLNPYHNVTIGIDILADKLSEDQGVEWALMAYNGGVQYANEMTASGQVSDYAITIMAEAYKLSERSFYE